MGGEHQQVYLFFFFDGYLILHHFWFAQLGVLCKTARIYSSFRIMPKVEGFARKCLVRKEEKKDLTMPHTHVKVPFK